MKQVNIKQALNSGAQVYMAKYDMFGVWGAWKPVDCITAQRKSYIRTSDGFCPYRFAIHA